jgi:hypothetical protein
VVEYAGDVFRAASPFLTQDRLLSRAWILNIEPFNNP